MLQVRQEYAPAVPWHVPHLGRWAWLLLLWLMASVLWVAQLSYAEKVSVEGVVQPVAAPVVVRSPSRGIVNELHAVEGTQVAAQQALMVLDNTRLGSSGVSEAALQLAQNRDEQRALQRRRTRLRTLHQQQQQLTASQRRSAAVQSQVLADQVQLSKQQAAALQTAHERALRLLTQRWLSPADVERSEVALLSARQTLLDRMREYQSVQARQRELTAQLGIQASQHAEQLAALQAQLSQLGHDVQRLQASQQTQLPAPISGRVVDLLVQEGRHVDPGEALLTITPPASGRHPIDVMLPSRAAARVRTGMPVHLRYAGYPHQDHGAVQGRVSYVSEVRQAGRQHPLFRARIRVDELPGSIDRVPAGMVVNVDILLRSQSLWRWLWQPVDEALQRL